MFDFTEFDKKVDSAALAQEVKEAPDFADVKKGDYIVSLEKMELTVTKQDQKPMFAAQFKIKEGDKYRVQDFEGKVLAIDNGKKNVTSNFTVSRESYGVRVEKLFPFNSPWIQAIKVVKKNASWRSKLYTERTFCSHKAVRKIVKK